MFIIGGTASKTVAEDLSKLLKKPIANTISKRFPDNELYVRILDDIKGQHIVIVQTTYPDPNLVELFLLQNAAEESGAKKITVVIPYYGYARQDTKFEDGEAISAKAIAGLISLNADNVITVDPHKEHILDFFSTSAHSTSAIPELAKYLKQKNIDMILAPDKGALDGAKKASKIIQCEFDHMEKTCPAFSSIKLYHHRKERLFDPARIPPHPGNTKSPHSPLIFKLHPPVCGPITKFAENPWRQHNPPTFNTFGTQNYSIP